MHTLRKSCLLLLFLAACARPHLPPLSPGDDAFHREIIERLEAQQARVRTLSAMARVVIINPQIRFAGNEVIHLQVPDRLHLETHDPLGGLQMLLVTEKERGLLLFPAESMERTFSPREENLKHFFGFDLTVAELVRLLAGSPPLPPLTPESIRSVRDDEGVVLSLFSKGRVRQRLRMNGAGEILRWDRLDGRGAVEVTLFFEEFREVDGVRFPFRILLQKEGKRVLQIHYQSIFLNRPLDPRLFEIRPTLAGGWNR